MKSKPQNSKILIIEDNPNSLKILTPIFEKSGYTVLCAENGEIGLQKTIHNHPDIILLDIHLPTIDGFETCRRLKANKQSKNIPVIFLTLLTNTEDKLKGFEVGAVDYITKPFQKEEVLIRVNTHLHLRQLSNHLEQHVQERTVDLEAANKKLKQEIIERNKIEATLKKTVFLQTMAQQIAKLGSWEWYFNTDTVAWSPEMYQIFDLNPTNYPDGMPLNKALESVHPDDQAKVEAANERVLKESKPIPTEYRIIRPDGTVRWVVGEGKLIQDSHGKPSSLVGMLQDITQRKQAEEELRQYEYIISSSTDMMAIIDRNFVYLAANSAYVEAFKLTTKELIGHTVTELFGPTFFETVIKPHALRCLSGEQINYQDWFNFPTHKPRYMDINYYPYFNHNNQITGFVVNARNISSRKQAEDALRESEAFLKAIFDNSLQAIMVADDVGNYRAVNQAAADMFGYSIKKLQTMNIGDLRTTTDPDALERYQQYLLKGKEIGEFEFINAANKPRVAHYHAIRIDDNFHLSILTDITERKEIEEQIKNYNRLLEQKVQEKNKKMKQLTERLLHQKKLATIGQLSNSIAYELRNPLGAVRQSVFYLNQLHNKGLMKSSNPKISKHLAFIEAELEMVNLIIASLLESTHTQPPVKKQIELKKITLEAKQQMRLKKQLHLHFNLNPTPFLFSADPLQFQQVLINIITNAIQAVKGDTHLTITAYILSTEKQIKIQIQDNGPGLNPETLDKIFEPLFTTKANSTGLGLNICKRIINNHGGTLVLHSQLGQGTIAEIVLPINT